MNNTNGVHPQSLPEYKQNDIDPLIKYTLKKKPIGTGSFSTVYLGFDTHNNKVAVKQIAVEQLDPTRIDKFLLELDISMKISHKNIVTCYEVFKTKKFWYIVTEFCAGGTMKNLIDDHKKTPWPAKEELAKQYFTQLKGALFYLHQNHIIHRDLKPLNILLALNTDAGTLEIKLADFGFARYFQETDDGPETLSATLCGSPIYMAPELLIDNKYNKKADLWSFGIVLYEFLYGSNPFFFPKNMPQLIDLILKQEIIFTPYFSDTCLDLLTSLLKIDTNQRIDWPAFFAHPWFTDGPLYASSPPQPHPQPHPNPEIFQMDYFEPEHQENELEHQKDEQELEPENEFVMVDNTIKPEVYNKHMTYGEKVTESVIKILGNWFNFPKSY